MKKLVFLCAFALVLMCGCSVGDDKFDMNDNSSTVNPSNGFAPETLKIGTYVNWWGTQIIDGKKCIIIPINEDEHTTVNGLDDLI